MTQQSHSSVGYSLQILMIEDSLSFARLTIAQLESAFARPHVVRHFDNVAAGLASLTSESADLIILDLHLPDSSGLDTFRMVYAEAREVPIVILSSDDSEQTALKAVQIGAEDYLVKGSDNRQVLVRSLRFAMERKRRLEAEEELNAARIIQQALLPAANPELEGFDIAGAMFPAVHTAGDYYDFISPLPARGEEFTGIVVADVSGHGHGPAMVMAETRGCLHAFTRVESDLARMLELTHEVLSSNQHSHLVTMFLACLNRKTRTLHYASAGHEGLLFPAAGGMQCLHSTGLPLGFGVSDFPWENADPLQLERGDILILPTDGFTETRNADGEFYGRDCLRDFIEQHRHESASTLVEQIQENVQTFADGATQTDDMTIVIVKVA